MTLFAKYVDLKTKVGGNREIYGYEETFGQPREEAMHITPPARFQVRILAQIEFAIRLSEQRGGEFDAIIDGALDFLLDRLRDEGALTKSAANRAEEMLLPLREAAKEYSLILAGHAHLDMNWMWSWHETVAATLATFRTMLKIMDEYPDFCFSQSQASVYRIVEEFQPDLMEPIKARIREGRWEVTASAWVETDKNMPSTESLIEHIRSTKKYMKEVWGVDPDSLEVDFSPDTFGHSANLPEIDLNGGLKYYYHCRGLDGDYALYRWRGLSGRELLCHKEQHWYNSGITPKIGLTAIDISNRSGGLKTGLIVYGVGDHGGGPTRRDVERAIEMMDWPIFPAIRFGTVREYFRIAESVRESLPVVDHELNLLFTGCYTTQSRIKRGNRQCEAAYADAHALSALAGIKAGAPFHGDQMEIAYRDVLFTHFHDILTGSCVQDTREHAMGLYSNALARFQNESLCAMNALSERIDTSDIATDPDPAAQAEGAGAGYGVDGFNGKPAPEAGRGLTRIFHLFNPCPVDKDECAEITVWDYVGDMRRIAVRDAGGNDLPFQMLSFRPESYWDHKFFRILVQAKVPALGYTTVVLSQKPVESYALNLHPTHSTQHPYSDFVLDNGIIRAVFDFKSGSLKSLVNLANGREYIRPGCEGSFVLIDTESKTSNAWNIGRYLNLHRIDGITEISGFGGDLRKGLRFVAKVQNSTVTATITLDRGARALSIQTEVDWNEAAGVTVPVLAYNLPLDGMADHALYDVPAGVISRPAGEQDAPGLTFCARPDGAGSAVLLSADCKYGYRARPDGSLLVTLINSAGSPDKYPERGIHSVTFHVGILPADPKALKESADSLIRRLAYVPGTAHSGYLPATGRLLSFEAKSSHLSTLSRTADGAILLRLVNLGDDPDLVKLTFDAPVTASAIDYFERPVEHSVETSGDGLQTEIAGHSILTLRVDGLA